MPPAILAFLVTAVSCLLLIMLAGQIGWIDRREGAEFRKPREERVPLVGGVAIAVGVLFASIFGTEGAFAATLSLSQLPWMALGGALILGLVDDALPGGLGARTKFSGQCLVAALFALDPGLAFEGASLAQAMGLALLCLVSMNAVNTYDHADGFAGGLAALAFLPGAPVLASATLGYLPFNIVFRHKQRRRGVGMPVEVGAPRAMLGDSGSHMLGVALVAIPGAAWFLLIPILDLARVVLGRIQRGAPFWRGDRTHLGHRLEGLGFHPTTCAAISGLVVAPPLAAVGLSTEYGMLAVTSLVSATLYFSILVISVSVAEEPLQGNAFGGPGEGMGSAGPEGFGAGRPGAARESGGGLGVLFPRRAESTRSRSKAPADYTAESPGAPPADGGEAVEGPGGSPLVPGAPEGEKLIEDESAGPFAG